MTNSNRPKIGYKLLSIEDMMFRRKKARWDGAPARNPKKGELFISGAEPMAYRAKQDMTTPYFIAREEKE